MRTVQKTQPTILMIKPRSATARLRTAERLGRLVDQWEKFHPAQRKLSPIQVHTTHEDFT
jgi:acyl-CoA synthetase (NDP forming)